MSVQPSLRARNYEEIAHLFPDGDHSDSQIQLWTKINFILANNLSEGQEGILYDAPRSWFDSRYIDPSDIINLRDQNPPQFEALKKAAAVRQQILSRREYSGLFSLKSIEKQYKQLAQYREAVQSGFETLFQRSPEAIFALTLRDCYLESLFFYFSAIDSFEYGGYLGKHFPKIVQTLVKSNASPEFFERLLNLAVTRFCVFDSDIDQKITQVLKPSNTGMFESRDISPYFEMRKETMRRIYENKRYENPSFSIVDIALWAGLIGLAIWGIKSLLNSSEKK